MLVIILSFLGVLLSFAAGFLCCHITEARDEEAMKAALYDRLVCDIITIEEKTPRTASNTLKSLQLCNELEPYVYREDGRLKLDIVRHS